MTFSSVHSQAAAVADHLGRRNTRCLVHIHYVGTADKCSNLLLCRLSVGGQRMVLLLLYSECLDKTVHVQAFAGEKAFYVQTSSYPSIYSHAVAFLAML